MPPFSCWKVPGFIGVPTSFRAMEVNSNSTVPAKTTPFSLPEGCVTKLHPAKQSRLLPAGRRGSLTLKGLSRRNFLPFLPLSCFCWWCLKRHYHLWFPEGGGGFLWGHSHPTKSDSTKTKRPRVLLQNRAAELPSPEPPPSQHHDTWDKTVLFCQCWTDTSWSQTQ